MTKEENSYKVNVSDTNTFKSGYRVVGNEQHNKEQSQCQNLSEGRVSTAENVEYIAKFSSAIHSLIMISESETPVNSEQIANSVGTNASYIRKLTTRLSKVGIIEGRKGISGFRLLKPAREISLLEIYKSIMEVNQVHIFDIHQNPNDECIVGRNIKPTLEGMFNRMEKEMEEKLAGMSLEDCVNAMRKELKEKE